MSEPSFLVAGSKSPTHYELLRDSILLENQPTSIEMISKKILIDPTERKEGRKPRKIHNVKAYHRRVIKNVPKKLKEEFDEAQKYLDSCPFFARDTWKRFDHKKISIKFSSSDIFNTPLGEHAVTSFIGSRASMEDTFSSGSFKLKPSLLESPGLSTLEPSEKPITVYYRAVFDGHGGGSACSRFLKDHCAPYFLKKFNELQSVSDTDIYHILARGFVDLGAEYWSEMEQESCCLSGLLSSLCKPHYPGSTAIFVLIIPEFDVIYSTNVGDSRAVIVTSNFGVIGLSDPANPEKERFNKSVLSLGGWFSEDLRVNGTLAMTDAIGHNEIGTGISPRGRVIKYKLSDLPKGDNYIVIASDGLWDVMCPLAVSELMEKITKEYHDTDEHRPITIEMTEILTKIAYQIDPIRCDNITIRIQKITRR